MHNTHSQIRQSLSFLPLLLAVPVVLGTVLAALPAFGYLPALGGEKFTLAIWRELFSVPGIGKSIQVSLIAGLITPAIALLLVFLYLSTVGTIAATGTINSTAATASAKATTKEPRLDRWLDRYLRRMVAPLLAVPHAAAAFGIAFLIAPAGLLTRLLSPELSGWQRPPDLLIINDPAGISMMFALIIKEIPFLLLMALAALPQIEPARRIHTARALGYGPVTAWLKTVAPALYPLLRLPLFAVIAFASSTVDTALILGPTLPPTLSVLILQWFNDPDLSRRFLAAAAALLQLALSLSAIGIWILTETIVKRVWHWWTLSGTRWSAEPLLRFIGRGGITLALLFTAAAMLTLILNAFAGPWRFPSNLPNAWTLSHWQQALPDLIPALTDTVLVATLATITALILTVITLEAENKKTPDPSTSHRSPLEGEPKKQGRSPKLIWWGDQRSATTPTLSKAESTGALPLYLPLLIPQVVFLFGIVVLSESLHLSASILLVAAAHLLFVLPYMRLSLAAAYRRLDPRWEQVAAALGAGPQRRFWRIRLPLLLAPLLTATAIGFAVSVGLFLPTQLLGAGRITTVTTEALALSSGGDRGLIAIWALLQAALPMLIFALALSLPRYLYRNRQDMKGAM